jgi:uncharacterized protein (TIGR03118 family)
MHRNLAFGRRFAIAGAAAAGLLIGMAQSPILAAAGDQFQFRQTNLVSNIPGMARFTDKNLKNPWGLSASSSSPLWVSDNGTGVSTLYRGDGTAVPLVVTIPAPGSPTGGAPTGTVFNGTGDFVISKGGATGPSRFLFATEDGTIAAWKPDADVANAVIAADRSDTAVYKGLAIASTASGNFLYAANFHDGTIDVFNKDFHQVNWAGAFTDPTIPAGFAPFNVQELGGKLYVTYALQKPGRHDDQAGPGNGFVNVFTTSGQLLRRLVSHGALNSPWGLAIAPATWGQFANDLLVGNFGDGRISAYNPRTGHFHGQLRDEEEQPIAISGLWGLRFGNGGAGGDPNALFFAAGINEEADGLFGTLTTSED